MSVISKATVLSCRNFGEDIREFTLQLDKVHYFEAGSFLLLTLSNQESYTRWPESRCFSIASAYRTDGIVKLIIRRVGEYTSRIFSELTVGATCMVKYAFGDFLLPFKDKTNPIVCIAGGTGIAPVLSFVEQLVEQEQKERVQVFYSFKNRDEMLGTDVLLKHLDNNQLHLFSTRQQVEGALNRRIEVSDIATLHLPLTTHYYICGNEDFTQQFAVALTAAGNENIYTDEW